jgi:hypothetical protein
MAKLALIYGMRLLPEEELGEVKDATVVLKNGRAARVTMHLIEGSKEEIENTFRHSIERKGKSTKTGDFLRSLKTNL